MNKQKAFFLLISLGLTIPASGKEIAAADSLLNMSIEELTQVKVIIASGIEQTKSDAPATVTLITEEDIKKTGASNLADILQTVPGVHIQRSAFGFRPEVRIRGAASTQTLLMINGDPIRDLVWNFGIFWKGIPASVIKRVEVIRGPGSALYGADASAGVINVITKTAGKITQNEAMLRAGSFDTQEGFIQYGQQWNDFDTAFTADYSTTEGSDPDIRNFENVRYGYNNQDIRFSLSNKNWQFLANYMRHTNLDTQISGYNFFDPLTAAEDERYDLDLIFSDDQFSDNWGIKSKLHYQNLNYDSNHGFRERPPGTYNSVSYSYNQINRMHSAERQAKIELTANYSGFDNQIISIGSGYNWQDLYDVDNKKNFGTGPDGNPLLNSTLIDLSDTPYAFAQENSRELRYLFIQDIWKFAADWELTSGIRYDHYSDFGDTINPRLALVWQSTEKLTSKFLYGQAFRAPNYQEIYGATSGSISNNNLDPEESETIELNFSYIVNQDLNFGVNIYQFKIDNFIRRITLANGDKQYQNTGNHKTMGIEVEAQWYASDHLSFSGNYTWRDPENNEYRVSEEPEQSAYLRTDWQFKPGWNWDIQANWIADRKRSDKDSRSNMDDYTVTDTTLRYSGLKNWEFAASMRNIFDENARDQAFIKDNTNSNIRYDLPLPERNAWAEIRYKF